MQHLLKREKRKEFKEQFFGNPFLLSVSVFVLAMTLNNFLETDSSKNFFSLCGYYFNYMFVWLNSTVQPHIQTFNIANPITPQVMSSINPWMWLRGYFLSALAVAFIVTIIKVRYVKPLNIVLLSVFTGILNLVAFVQPYLSKLPASWTYIMQSCYINIPSLMIITFIGFLTGIHLATYFFGEVKKSRYKNGENVFIKYMNENDWDPN